MNNPTSEQDNCSRHKRDIATITNMKLIAEMIGDLHYESLTNLLFALSLVLYRDGLKDRNEGRENLGYALDDASVHVNDAAERIKDAWEISKPFMNKTKGE